MVATAVVIVGGCTTAEEGATGLPDELAAEDGESSRDSNDGRGDGELADGFDPIEDVETEPVEPPGAETVDLTAETPDEVIDGLSDDLADDLVGLGPDIVAPDRTTPTDDGDGELLDAVGPIDKAESPADEPDGRARNGAGELFQLDDEASLACAQIEIAIGQLDVGLPAVAAERILAGAERAESSGIADIRSWSGPLRAVIDGGSIDDPAPLVGFLSVCTEGGYEL